MNIIQKIYKYFLKKVYKHLRLLLIKNFGIGRPKTKDKWNEEYSKGKWDYLLSDIIEEKNTLITKTIFANLERPNILDVGCGNGALIQSINEKDFNYYLGVDKSENALMQFNKKIKKGNKIELIASEIDKVNFKHQFDCAIFNEVLYYINRPINTLRRILKHMNEDSLIIISMTVNDNNEKIWNKLSKNISEVNRFKVKTSDNSMCRISIYETLS